MASVKKEKTGQFSYFLCVRLVFLERRLDFTKHYNLVGRLGGREENRLATITATLVSGIWSQLFRKTKRKRGSRQQD